MSVGHVCCLGWFLLQPRGMVPLAYVLQTAKGPWALSEVWMASHPGVRSPTAGLRCSRTVVPGAEVFSISVPPPARTNLKPQAYPPALPPFNCSILQLSLEMSIQRAESGPLEQTQVLDALGHFCLPRAWLLPHPCSGHPEPVFTSRALVSHVLEASCLDSSLHPHLRYSLRRPGISTCSP